MGSFSKVVKSIPSREVNYQIFLKILRNIGLVLQNISYIFSSFRCNQKVQPEAVIT